MDRAPFVSDRTAAVSLGMAFLIFIVIAFVVLIVLSGALREYIVSGFNYLASLIGETTNSTGQIGTVTTPFVAYLCSSSCAQFQNITPYNSSFWYVYYNGQNLSARLPSPIYFSTPVGNYSFTVYNVTAGSTLLCSNLSYGTGKTEAGVASIIYYSSCG